MKGSFTIILIFLFSILFGQQKTISGDSLGKYSYQVFTMNSMKGTIDFGTSFFIKRNGDLFLVTARHIFIHCDSLTNKQKYPYDNIFVFLPRSTRKMVPIYFKKPSDTCSCLPIEKDTDLAIIKMENSLLPFINTVEDFVLPPFKKLGVTEIYGQGFQSDTEALRFTDPHRIHLPADSFEVLQMIGDIKTRIIDSLNYYFASKTVKIGSWLKGFSGSPVFLQEYNTKEWRLAGVFIGAEILVLEKMKSDVLLVVKQDYILSAIDSKYGIK